jgi:hypothetical protein
MTRVHRVLSFALLISFLSIGRPASAQSDSSIAGLVRDTTAGVLPGVTVEVSSAALIERTRSAVTDDQGQYKIVGLRPGTYTVTFSLTGFSVVRREGIDLTASFTATVNAELRVGTLEETVTVSGQSPVVDVQNSVQQKVLSHEIIDSIPSGKMLHQLTQLIPGASMPLTQQDVGGSTGENTPIGVTMHGSRSMDMTLQIDGLRYNGMDQPGGGANGLHINPGGVQEVSLETGGISAETQMGGIRSNIIPREGGNRFKTFFASSFTNHSLQSDNLSDELKARGLTAVNTVEKIWDLNPAFGGPIKKDSLWFYTAFRYWGTDGLVAGSYHDVDPLDWVYTPDRSRQAIKTVSSGDEQIRLTWQASRRNKLNLYYDIGQHCNCQNNISATVSPEATSQWFYQPNYVAQASWSSPVTTRLLLEAGVHYTNVNYQNRPQPEVADDVIGVLEQSTNTQYRASPTGYYPDYAGKQVNQRFVMSYVTGSHAFRTGINTMAGWKKTTSRVNGNVGYQFLNGQPNRITLYASPLSSYEKMKADLGLFAQDQWTIKRLTVNAGVRFDYLNTYVPEQHVAAVRFLPARDYAAIPNLPLWKDLSPRFGIAYDLFGNGKTAIKANLGEYVVGVLVQIAAANNPARAASVTSATRTWTDLNGDFVPDGNFADPTLNGELGPLSDLGFGDVRITTRYDPEVLNGWNRRVKNWEGSVGIQHEVITGLSLNASYHRRWYNNFTTTDNLETVPGDFDQYCVTAPGDARLPGGGGGQVCGLYDVTPTKFGRVNNLVTFTDRFGDQAEVFDGIDLTVNGRTRTGVILSGGLSTGRTRTANCSVIDSPGVQRFCDVRPPFWLPQLKMMGVYPLPYALQASATLQSIPGPEIRASYVAPNAVIRPSLGRDLSAGANSTSTVELIAPGSLFEARINQVDVRLSRVFRLGTTRLQAMFDAYNVLNAGSILAVNTRFGPAWLTPTQILSGRLFKFGVQLDF